MRTHPLASLVVATLATLVAMPAAAMFKCTSRDGTVLYQARPCSAGEREAPLSTAAAQEGGAGPRGFPTKDAQERAILERDLAQRRARCANYREAIERQKPLLDSANDVTKQHAVNEVRNQERRIKEDSCVTL